MDNDQYVPIRIIASFPMVKRLTLDMNVIVEVLRGKGSSESGGLGIDFDLISGRGVD